MHLIKKFFPPFNKITFKNPKKAKILIYDYESSDLLIDSMLYGLEFSIFPARQEFFYISPQILFKMAKKIFMFDFQYLKKIKSYVYKAYALSCVEYINPKIVITFIDNDFTFQWLSKKYNNAEFYSIQNGHRSKTCVYYEVLNSDNTIKLISMPNFVCFGQSDVDNLLKYGHTIETAHCVGSLRGSYKHLFKNKPEKNKYSICFVSQHDDTPFFRCDKGSILWQEVEEPVYNLLNLYLEKYHLPACIACRSSTKEEYNFFLDRFGDKVTILPAKITNNISSTYELMESSEVIIALNSTAAYEALGWGKKVLFCFFHDDEEDPYYKDSLFSIRKSDPTEFENKLNALFDMNQDDYEMMTAKDRKYLMNYNPDVPVHVYMRNIIENLIRDVD